MTSINIWISSVTIKIITHYATKLHIKMWGILLYITCKILTDGTKHHSWPNSEQFMNFLSESFALNFLVYKLSCGKLSEKAKKPCAKGENHWIMAKNTFSIHNVTSHESYSISKFMIISSSRTDQDNRQHIQQYQLFIIHNDFSDMVADLGIEQFSCLHIYIPSWRATVQQS